MELEIGRAPNVALGPEGVLWETIPTIRYTVLEDAVKNPEKKPQKQPVREIVTANTPIASQTFVVVDNNVPIIEGTIAANDAAAINAPVVSSNDDKVGPPVTTSILGVEHVPVFPGCESAITNETKIDCMFF